MTSFARTGHLSFDHPGITEWSLDQHVSPVPSPPWFTGSEESITFLDDREKPEQLLAYLYFATREPSLVSMSLKPWVYLLTQLMHIIRIGRSLQPPQHHQGRRIGALHSIRRCFTVIPYTLLHLKVS